MSVPAGLNRPGDVSIIAGTPTIPAFENLTPAELKAFDRDLVKIAGYYAFQRDLYSLFLEDRDTYLFGACIAKKELNAGFGGAVPGSSEFGLQIIRAKLILGADSWLRTITTAGWNNILGSSAAPIDLSTTSSTYGNPQNRVTLMIPKLIDYAIPKINEVWFFVNPTQYPIWVTKFMQISNVSVANLPASIYIAKNNRFYMRGNVEGSNVSIGVAPLGLTYALAPFMVGSAQE
jgi:hypothetical protein